MFDSILFALLVALPCILFSMTLHEAMHAFMGNWLGDDTARLEGRLSLNPAKHIDPFLTLALPLMLIIFNGLTASSGIRTPIFGAAKPVPFNPNRVKYDEFGVALIGLAGPLTNFALAIVGGIIFRIIGFNGGELVGSIILTFVTVNLGFFIFNMIPFPPLDGSRVLYAFAPEPIQRGMRVIESYGFFAIAGFVFVIYPLIRVFIDPVYTKLFRTLTGI